MWNLPVHSNLGHSQIIYTNIAKMKHQVAGLTDKQNSIFSGNSSVALWVLGILYYSLQYYNIPVEVGFSFKFLMKPLLN
jgi:hypothetical protein